MPRTTRPWEYEAPLEEIQGPDYGGLAKRGISTVLSKGRGWFNKQIAEQLISTGDPGGYRLLKKRQAAGEEIPLTEIIEHAHRVQTPGWTGPTGLEKGVATAAKFMKYPAMGLGASLAGGVAGPIGAVAGGALGWSGMEALSGYYDPESAEESLLWDLAGAAGAKVLGTAGAMAYRAKLQPMLAAKGLLSKGKSPIASRVLETAERALNPAVGPAATNYGLPRWVNRRLARIGPQGMGQAEAATRGRVAAPVGRMAPGRQIEMPLQQRLALSPKAGKPAIAQGLPAFPGGAYSAGPLPVQQRLPFRPVQRRFDFEPSAKIGKAMLEELPVEPEFTPTISGVTTGWSFKHGETIPGKESVEAYLRRKSALGMRGGIVGFEDKAGRKALYKMSAAGAFKPLEEDPFGISEMGAGRGMVENLKQLFGKPSRFGGLRPFATKPAPTRKQTLAIGTAVGIPVGGVPIVKSEMDVRKKQRQVEQKGWQDVEDFAWRLKEHREAAKKEKAKVSVLKPRSAASASTVERP